MEQVLENVHRARARTVLRCEESDDPYNVHPAPPRIHVPVVSRVQPAANPTSSQYTA